ncbi:MAG: hypothetical protein LQ349_008606, partial [Xanthoria aureola]
NPLRQPPLNAAPVLSRHPLSDPLPSALPLFHSGTHRLEDVEGVNSGTISGARAPQSKALSESGIYQGQNKQQPHKSWNNAGAHVSSKKTGRHSEEGSEEDMMPMGRIHAKHDLEWEQERGPRRASQSGGTPDTLR